MADKTFVEAYSSNMFKNWTDITKINKPTIAAVSGYALGMYVYKWVGGGCGWCWGECRQVCVGAYAGVGG